MDLLVNSFMSFFFKTLKTKINLKILKNIGKNFINNYRLSQGLLIFLFTVNLIRQ